MPLDFGEIVLTEKSKYQDLCMICPIKPYFTMYKHLKIYHRLINNKTMNTFNVQVNSFTNSLTWTLNTSADWIDQRVT